MKKQQINKNITVRLDERTEPAILILEVNSHNYELTFDEAEKLGQWLIRYAPA